MIFQRFQKVIFIIALYVIDFIISVNHGQRLGQLKKYSKRNPNPNITSIASWYAYRRQLQHFVGTNNFNNKCGIIWAVASINGSDTNYKILNNVGRGEARMRLLGVLYEAMASASRVRHAFQLNSTFPSFCNSNSLPKDIKQSSHQFKNGVNTSTADLTLFIDRDIINNLRDHDLLHDIKCTFDKIVYFDSLPNHSHLLQLHDYRKLHLLSRIPPRPNAMKLIALLSTPYEYTLYMDGDTGPCTHFQYEVFDKLRHYDILTTPNPFGYQSTNGMKIYSDSPNHRHYADFKERNGGILAYKWSNKTQYMLTRALELIPHFASLGFDQDQAMMRHALFESIHLDELKEYKGRMNHYCRHGWKCDFNSCNVGCVVIHTRKCLMNGLAVRHPLDQSYCALNSEKILKRANWYIYKNSILNIENKPKRNQILKNIGS